MKVKKITLSHGRTGTATTATIEHEIGGIDSPIFTTWPLVEGREELVTEVAAYVEAGGAVEEAPPLPPPPS